jgi:hypothetical protein
MNSNDIASGQVSLSDFWNAVDRQVNLDAVVTEYWRSIHAARIAERTFEGKGGGRIFITLATNEISIQRNLNPAEFELNLKSVFNSRNIPGKELIISGKYLEWSRDRKDEAKRLGSNGINEPLIGGRDLSSFDDNVSIEAETASLTETAPASLESTEPDCPENWESDIPNRVRSRRWRWIVGLRCACIGIILATLPLLYILEEESDESGAPFNSPPEADRFEIPERGELVDAADVISDSANHETQISMRTNEVPPIELQDSPAGNMRNGELSVELILNSNGGNLVVRRGNMMSELLFARFEGGEFSRGVENGPLDAPKSMVRLSPFQFSRKPLSEQMAGIIWNDKEFTEDVPVSVTWDEADAMTRELSRGTEAKIRLVWEAEWEYVAMTSARQYGSEEHPLNQAPIGAEWTRDVYCEHGYRIFDGRDGRTPGALNPENNALRTWRLWPVQSTESGGIQSLEASLRARHKAPPSDPCWFRLAIEE